jgi:hypothetical protein
MYFPTSRLSTANDLDLELGSTAPGAIRGSLRNKAMGLAGVYSRFAALDAFEPDIGIQLIEFLIGERGEVHHFTASGRVSKKSRY